MERNTYEDMKEFTAQYELVMKEIATLNMLAEKLGVPQYALSQNSAPIVTPQPVAKPRPHWSDSSCYGGDYADDWDSSSANC
jgi:hypothetical protein